MEEVYSPRFWELFESLDVPSGLPGPDQLHVLAHTLIAPGDLILDVGCRDAAHLIRLVVATGACGIGIDPVPWHIDRAASAIEEAGLQGRISVRRGVAEALTEADQSIDVVWCRDVLEVLPDLDGAVAEMARVLRPEGCVIAYTNFTADDAGANDLDRLHLPLGNVPGNLSRPRVAATLTRHGLAVVEEVTVGTGWREFLEERDRVTSRDLLRLARLRRRRDEIVTEYGTEAFATAEASLQWSVQQFLGNLVPTILVLRRVQS